MSMHVCNNCGEDPPKYKYGLCVYCTPCLIDRLVDEGIVKIINGEYWIGTEPEEEF